MALNSKRRILALTGVLAVALTATACGSSDDDQRRHREQRWQEHASTARPTRRSVTSRARRSPSTRRSSRPRTRRTTPRTSRSRTAPASRSSTRAPSEFEAQLPVRVKGGNAPDIALHPAARSAQDPGRDRSGQGGAARDRGQRRQEHARLEAATARSTASSTRAAARRQREVLRLVLPAGRSRTRATRSPRRGTSCSRSPTRSSPTTPAATSSRGAPASSPVTPPAGRPPTGSRTSCSARRVPRSTTSGSTTRSRSTTPRSPRRWPRSARSSRTTSTSTAASATSRRSPRRPSRTPACRSSRARAPCTVRRSFYAANFPEGTKVGRGRRRVGLLPAGRRRVRPSRSSAPASSSPPSPTVPRSRRSRPTSPRPSGPTSARRLRPNGGCVTANKNADPQPAQGPVDKLSARDPHRQVGDVPVRRFRPHAGRRRCGHVLEGHDQLDHRHGRQGDARLHRAVLAEELTLT